MLSAHWPIRDKVISMLCPSEIMDLCIATRTYLSKYEVLRYMNPLREIFYSLTWVDKLISESSDIVLLGRDVYKLSDSRETRLNLWLITYRSPESFDFTNILKHNDVTPQLLERLRSICNIQHIRPEVNIIPLRTPDPDLSSSTKRINLITDVMDTRRTFILSLNSLPYIVRRSDDVNENESTHNFRYVRRRMYEDTFVHIPFILYTKYTDVTYNKKVTTKCGIETLKLTKFHYRPCHYCKDIIYVCVQVDKYYWPHGSAIGCLDIQWRLWFSHIKCNSDSPLRHAIIMSTTQFDSI